MAKTTRSKVQQAMPPITYELAFQGGFQSIAGYVEADLTSPSLDPVLHPTGKLRVHVWTRASGPKRNTGFVLDAFHSASLMEYLRTQTYVRSTLEKELDRERTVVKNVAQQLREGSVWDYAKVLSLDLKPRNAPTRQTLERLKKILPELSVEQALPGADKPDTRSTFTVVLEVWSDEHWRMAKFREGEFVDMSEE